MQNIPINNIILSARPIAYEHDVKKYNKIYAIIESYIKDNDLIIFSSVHENRVYTIFSDDPYKHGKILVDKIYIEEEIVSLKTHLSYTMLSIYVDFKLMVNLYVIKPFEDMNIIEMINPIKGDFLFIPPEIELIIVYWKLYSIHEHENWKKYEERKTELLASEVRGGLEVNIPKKPAQYVDILKELMQIPYIIIGINSVNDNITDTSERIQCISDDPDAYSLVKKLLPDQYITQKSHKLQLPIDFRLKRITLYTTAIRHGKPTDLPIIDIFNSATYELIPYHIKNDMKIGHPYVVLKFLYIDLWILKLRKKNLPPNIYNMKYSMIVDAINKLDNREINLVYGTHYNECVYLKKQALLKPIPQYTPYKK